MEVNDPRRTDLYVSAATFVHQHELHPDPSAYLAHGYVDLCLRAWPGAAYAPLHLATQWALWTWLADDVFDQELKDASRQEVGILAADLVSVLHEDGGPVPGDHPVVRALADLIAQTRPMMPDWWWERYRAGVEAWILAAVEKLQLFVQPSRTPTLREYQVLRPTDGGMLLAAQWCELAHQVVSPDWRDPLVQSLLRSFSTVGCLVNDLAAADGDTFNAVQALVASEGLAPGQARECIRGLLEAEVFRFWWVYRAVRREIPSEEQLATALSGPVLDTGRFAWALDMFRRALTDWTRTSSRYAPAPPSSVSGTA